MALSDWEKQEVIDQLDLLEDAVKRVVLASLEAFSEWLANVLYRIYLKIKSMLRNFWEWLCSNLL